MPAIAGIAFLKILSLVLDNNALTFPGLLYAIFRLISFSFLKSIETSFFH